MTHQLHNCYLSDRMFVQNVQSMYICIIVAFRLIPMGSVLLQTRAFCVLCVLCIFVCWVVTTHNKVTFLIQKRNTLHIPLAMHVQGWQNGLAGKNWRHALPPLWDSSIRSSSMHKEKALIIEGEINSGRKKDWRAQGRQDGGGLHEKKGEEAKKIVGEPQSRNQRQSWSGKQYWVHEIDMY